MENEELAKQQLDNIRNKIRTLVEIPTEDKDNLRDGIKDLQRALLDNPAACSLMLPEDIGKLVSVIRTYVGKEVKETATKAAVSRSKKVNIDPARMDAMLEDF